MTYSIHSNENKLCPWGKAQHVTPLGDDVEHITTAGHGGFYVSDAAYATMPAKYKACSFTNDQFFEEDCSWCGVALAFPELFEPHHIEAAQRLFDNYYSKKTA